MPPLNIVRCNSLAACQVRAAESPCAKPPIVCMRNSSVMRIDFAQRTRAFPIHPLLRATHPLRPHDQSCIEVSISSPLSSSLLEQPSQSPPSKISENVRLTTFALSAANYSSCQRGYGFFYKETICFSASNYSSSQRYATSYTR